MTQMFSRILPTSNPVSPGVTLKGGVVMYPILKYYECSQSWRMSNKCPLSGLARGQI